MNEERKMTEWEYKIISPNIDETALNKLGDDGWELCIPVANYSTGWTTSLIMKRPRPPVDMSSIY